MCGGCARAPCSGRDFLLRARVHDTTSSPARASNISIRLTRNDDDDDDVHNNDDDDGALSFI